MDKLSESSINENTIKSWVELYSDSLYSWSFYKTNNKETSEDLVQDTFIVAFQSIHKFEGRSEPKTWLFAILNNKIAEHFRKIYKQATVTESQTISGSGKSIIDTMFDSDGSWNKESRPQQWQSEQSNLLDDANFTTALQSCMQKLPENWLSAIQLKYLENKKAELICQELEITTTNYWQVIHRAKLQLRKCLEIHWFKK